MRNASFGILIVLLAAVLTLQTEAAGKFDKSDSKVKATATATKPGADGRQTVTITLDINEGWHLYANPVNHTKDGYNINKTVVKIAAKEKVTVDVKYPPGKTKVDKLDKTDKYDIYAGVVKIQADVVRRAGDTSPLDVSIIVSACSENECLDKATVKLAVP
jgi:hypothetical protein